MALETPINKTLNPNNTPQSPHSAIIKRLVQPPNHGFRHGVNIQGLSIPRTALYELMFCSADSEELVALVKQAGGVGCMLQDIVHLTTTIALPLIQTQLQVRGTTRTESWV